VRLLPDTSVWVDYLRGRNPETVAELDSYFERESVDVHRPIVADLLAGTAPDQREDLWLAIGSLPWADLDRAAWRQVGEVANDLRRRGVSVPLTDVVIAVAAARSDAGLWTHDRDFERSDRFSRCSGSTGNRTQEAVRPGTGPQPFRKVSRTRRVLLSWFVSITTTLCHVPRSRRPSSTGMESDGGTSTGSRWSRPWPRAPCRCR